MLQVFKFQKNPQLPRKEQMPYASNAFNATLVVAIHNRILPFKKRFLQEQYRKFGQKDLAKDDEMQKHQDKDGQYSESESETPEIELEKKQRRTKRVPDIGCLKAALPFI